MRSWLDVHRENMKILKKLFPEADGIYCPYTPLCKTTELFENPDIPTIDLKVELVEIKPGLRKLDECWKDIKIETEIIIDPSAVEMMKEILEDDDG